MRLLLLLFLVGCRGRLCADCDEATEFCVIHGSDVGSIPSTSACRPFPASCRPEDGCGCIESSDEETDIDWCLGSQCRIDDGMVTALCPGG